jgi:hypothetical protein
MKVYIVIRRIGPTEFGSEHVVRVFATEKKAKNFISIQEDKFYLDYEVWVVN